MSRKNLGNIDRHTFTALGRVIQDGFNDGLEGDIIRGGRIDSMSAQGVYEESSSKNYLLGSILEKDDGRKFVYCKAGGSGLDIAAMLQAPAPTSDWAENAQTAYGFSAGDVSGNIVIGGTDPGANGWKNGLMIVNKGTNTGQIYKILSNEASASNPAVVLERAVISDIAAADEITVVVNENNGVIVVPKAALSAQLIGVPLIGVTASYYFWAQISGPAPLLVDTGETVVIGQPVGLPATAAVDGACAPLGGATVSEWGKVVTVAAADEYAIVDLSIG